MQINCIYRSLILFNFSDNRICIWDLQLGDNIELNGNRIEEYFWNATRDGVKNGNNLARMSCEEMLSL
jgi:hypothetical protein